MLANGTYKTVNGSILVVSGKYSGIYEVDFDRYEEENACEDCKPQPQPDDDDRLVWSCDVCGGGSAPWIRVDSKIDVPT